MPSADEKIAFTFGPYLLTPETRRLEDTQGRLIELRGKGFELLLYLIQHAGRLIEKGELMQAIWPDTIVEENNLSQAVSALRHALEDDSRQPKYLATIKGRGYQFVGDVRQITAGEALGTDAKPRFRMPIVVVIAAVTAIAVIVLVTFVGPARDRVPGTPTPTIVERFADAKLQLITDYPGSHSEPALSAAGDILAYVSDVGGTSQVWIKIPGRGEPTPITRGPFPAGNPTWTPDNQVMYAQADADNVSIYRIGVLGNAEPELVIAGATSPNHAQQADAFVYSTGSRIWLARNGGRDREQVLGIPRGQGFAAREPALSPDGTMIAFIHADEGPLGNLWLIPSAGGEARQLTTPEAAGGIASAPAWSSDGRYVVYSVNADTGNSHLWRIDVASGEVAALTVGPGGADEATLSTDGARMAYVTAWPQWQLTRIDLATLETSTVYESRMRIVLPVASPDRRTFVFFGQNSSGTQIFTIGSDGTNLKQHTFDKPGQNALPTWSGDARSILYYRGRSLYRLNPADGSDAMIFADFHWSSRNWLDAHSDRVSYHKVNRPTGERRTVVRGVGEDEETELPVPIEAAQWSEDGTELLGTYRSTAELFICRSDGASCRTIDSAGEPLKGARPMWSPDGSQIYYLHTTEEDRQLMLWRVDSNGSNNEMLTELPGFEMENSSFDFTADGAILYNRVEGSEKEIWMADVDVE